MELTRALIEETRQPDDWTARRRARGLCGIKSR
jgi:hypothetical protein